MQVLRRAHQRAVTFVAVLAAVLGLAAAGALATAAPAAAAVTDGVVRGGPNDPFGRVRYITAVPGGLRLIGFAIDPSALTSNVRVAALIDGRASGIGAKTSVPRSAVTSAFHAGPTPAFDLTVPVPAGKHTVCLAAQNIGVGLYTVLRCIATPLGRVLSGAEAAAHSPVGAVTGFAVAAGRLRVTGWGADPDFVERRVNATLFVDGVAAQRVVSNSTPSPRPANAGPRSAFLADVPISAGSHIACLWLGNVGFGSNTKFGCRAFDTRGAAGTGALPAPPVNAAVLAEALTHRHQHYVWAAAGPKTFDCSGLVVYSYAKSHIALPHQSGQQFRTARLIPASRAVPGDLVFTYDSAGDVYHVGIYVSPGLAFAAIDTAHGVDYQRIWDPAHTAYGSITHI